MIVDDHSDFRMLLKALLSPLHARFSEYENAEEAMRSYAIDQPELILMDLQLGGMDGLSATARIVREHPGAQIVLLTDYDDEDLRSAALEAGARDFLHKENLLPVRQLIADLAESKDPIGPYEESCI